MWMLSQLGSYAPILISVRSNGPCCAPIVAKSSVQPLSPLNQNRCAGPATTHDAHSVLLL